MLVTDYLRAADDGKSALIISPTHAEGERLTDELRAALKERGAIVAIAPEWLTVAKDFGTSSVSQMKSLMSLAGIHAAPSLALMSPGRRSAGWTAFSASTLCS